MNYRKFRRIIKELLCKALGKHTKFIPGTHKGDIKEWGIPGHVGWGRRTKFRCANCDGLV